MANQRLRRKYVLVASTMLTKHCQKVGNKAVYDEGWSDDRVTEELNRTVIPRDPDFNFTRTHVEGLRKEMIGNLIDKGTPSSTTKELEELREGHRYLLQRIERLEKWANLRPVGSFPLDPNEEIRPAPGSNK